MAIYYIGAFPPGYGGVTIKNQNLYEALSQKIRIEKVDLNQIKRHNFREAARLIRVLLNPHNRFVLGPSGQRKYFTRLLYTINRNAMQHSVIMLMGGTAAAEITADKSYCKWAAHYKRIYVETQGMIQQLRNGGLTNGAVYPNGRFQPHVLPEIRISNHESLKCLFFSQVSKEKGVDLVIQASKSLPSIDFTVYGSIPKEYEEEFQQLILPCKNIRYCGTFKGQAEEVYNLLNSFDVLLFPTRWKHEGVPGVLVESKIAGLPAIVSDIAFNAELVENGISGIVMQENTSEKLIREITKLNQDRNLLYRLKQGSKSSAEQYYIENYIDDIIAELKQ